MRIALKKRYPLKIHLRFSVYQWLCKTMRASRTRAAVAPSVKVGR
jgi:hypothetical protein